MMDIIEDGKLFGVFPQPTKLAAPADKDEHPNITRERPTIEVMLPEYLTDKRTRYLVGVDGGEPGYVIGRQSKWVFERSDGTFSEKTYRTRKSAVYALVEEYFES